MSQFDFLKTQFGEIHTEAAAAEQNLATDHRVACFYARRALEVAVHWLYAHDTSLPKPYDNMIGVLLNEQAMQNLLGTSMWHKAREVQKIGNAAVHKPKIDKIQAASAVTLLHSVCWWLAHTYGKTKPTPGVAFDAAKAMGPAPQQAQASTEELAQLEAKLNKTKQIGQMFAAKSAKLEGELEVSKEEIDALKAEIAAVMAEKAKAPEIPEEQAQSEANTRRYLIDIYLAEAGWDVEAGNVKEYPVTGMPGGKAGNVDYVLWGDDGKPLAVIEAKRTTRDAKAGRQQAKLYADCLEEMTGQRPLVFYSNGFEHHLWDDTRYAPRQVAGFLTKDQLELAVQRRSSLKPLNDPDADTAVDPGISGRPYQMRAIGRICDAFEKENRRRSLLVMATGSGKTRTVVSLADLLIRANWAKRVLFLADRKELVKQAKNAFTEFLPHTTVVNLLEDKKAEGRVYVCTHQTMISLIDNTNDAGERRFGPGHFDLIVIDEAHRSVFNKYGEIFNWFDGLLVGLTATLRDEIDRSTYRLFNLEDKVPTDVYSLEQAIEDGYLVPFRPVSVDLKFPREGIRYDDLSDEEKEEWDEADWDDDPEGEPPDAVGANEINKWLFNIDTVDKMLAHLMTHGHKVEGGDRLGKTIVFAKTQAHAEFIGERFDINYPHYKGEFARVITSSVEHNSDLIDKFKIANGNPHMAVSVDMLDTGIDVPEVVNLVFFKMVRSKTKFWQMIGRGTRLCPGLYGPGVDKENFFIFDYCGNLEFFGENPDGIEGSVAPSLSAKLFSRRLELLNDLGDDETDLKTSITGLLHAEVDAMNVDNFVVRPHRELVDKFSDADQWKALDANATVALTTQVAGLPSELDLDHETARRFDLLALNLQLAHLKTEPTYQRLMNQMREIAAHIEALPDTIPAVAAQRQFILAIQEDEWWEGVTLKMLEQARLNLRLLVQFIEPKKRKVVYTDIADELVGHAEIDPATLIPTTETEFGQFEKKMRRFIDSHRDNIALQKIYRNQPLTPVDLSTLEGVLVEADISKLHVDAAAKQAGSFPKFLRSLTGLDRKAAKELFADFLADDAGYNATQIDYINTVINELCEAGTVDPGRFYEDPYTGMAPTGPEDLFGSKTPDLITAANQATTTLEVA